MEKDLYLTEAPFNQTPDTTILPQKQRPNIHLKSLANPNDRRNQISKKSLSNFPLESYYDDKKIKPGISLYKAIIQTEDKRRDGEWTGPYLQISMHPTVTFTDNVNTMIYSDQGIIKTMNYISYENFVSAAQITDDQIRNEQQITPMVMTKCCNGITFEHTIVMNNEISPKIIPRSENVISTKFIIPYANYPNIIRLFFIPKHVKNTKKNVAYKVINRKQITEDAFKKKHRLSNQFMVNLDCEDSYIATLMKGKALDSCEQMAASLCEYLEHALLIQISEIVMDFIVDDNKNIYFNDIKAVRSKAKTKMWQIGTEEQIIKMASQNNSQIMCRLCGMLYTKHDMEKLVTNKLIYELISHLENRGKKFDNIPHMKKQGLSNVCHLCYELIKAEHTLINVERDFSKLMNIRQGTVERVQSKQTKHQQLFFYDEEEFQKLGEQTSKYKKWRLFFYLEKLKRIPEIEMPDAQNVEITLEMKFQNQKEKFVKTVKNENYDPVTNAMNMTKNWSKSVRTGQNNYKRDSSCSSRKSTLRVQSAMPHKQRYRKDSQVEAGECQNAQQEFSMVHGGVSKNKSYFNDQSTCITHSQSYFSSLPIDKSRSENENNTTLHQYLQNNTSHLAGGNHMIIKEQEEDAWDGPVANLMKKNNNTNNNSYGQQSSAVAESVKVDKVKMFIFYTKAHENQGKNILSDEEIEFTLSFTQKNLSPAHTRDPQTIKFSGKSSTLKCLKNKETCQRHSLEIYLFDQGMKYCNLELTVGMLCDGVYDDEGLDLEKYNNLYWGKTYSCEPLPDEWMEVFTNGEQVPKSNIDQVLQDLEKHNFVTQPIQLSHEPSINYLKSFEQFSKSSIKPFCVNNSQSRPMSGLPSSKSTTMLKKMSSIRCKTAINRNTVSYSNLMTQNQGQKYSQNQNSNRATFLKSNRKILLESIENEDDENQCMDFDAQME